MTHSTDISGSAGIGRAGFVAEHARATTLFSNPTINGYGASENGLA